MRVHIFCSDIVPDGVRAVSGGGLRSWQIIEMMTRLGHDVTFSEPEQVFLRNQDGTPAASKFETYVVERHDIVRKIERHRPNLVIFCNAMTCEIDAGIKARLGFNVVLDVHGPAFVEAAFILGESTDRLFAPYFAKLRLADGIFVVHELQRGALLGWFAANGVMSDLPWIIDVPLDFPPLPIERKLSAEPSVLYAGYIYPWQDPGQALLTTADFLQELGRGELWLATGHHRLNNQEAVETLFDRLAKNPYVKAKGILQQPALHGLFAQTWCCLEVMSRNVERELAVTTRTWQQLGCGIPVITNDYSALAPAIAEADAGWIVDSTSDADLRRALAEIVADRAAVIRKGENARRLIERRRPMGAVDERVARRVGGLPSRSTQRRARVGKPRVLLASYDMSAIMALRGRAPLDALFEADKIAGYSVLDSSGRFLGPHSFEEFDCLMILREVAEPLVELVLQEQRPFVYDVDDLMLAPPSYSNLKFNRSVEPLGHAATVFCMTSDVLMENFAAESGRNIRDRTVIVKNGLAFPRANPSSSAEIKALVWTSSDYTSLRESREPILGALRDFAREKNLPIYLYGVFPDDLENELPSARRFGFLEFWNHKNVLASHSGLLGVAPLEDKADARTMKFIESKSDLKMVEFGGYGHAAVYSNVMPFSRSDLRTGSIVENSYQGWIDGLREAYARHGDENYVNTKYIRAERDIRHISTTARWEAIERGIDTRGILRVDIEKAFGAMPEALQGRRLAYRAADRLYGAFDRLPRSVQLSIVRGLRLGRRPE